VFGKNARQPDDLLETAALPGLAFGVHMPDFAGKAVTAAKKLAVDEDAASDAAFHDDEEGDAAMDSGAVLGGPDGEGVGVGFYMPRRLEVKMAQGKFGEIDVFPAEQRRKMDDAVEGELGGRGNADPFALRQTVRRKIGACKLHRVADGVLDAVGG